MPYGLSNETVARIRAVFARHPEVRQAILYGSRAMGTQRDGSDIDLTKAFDWCRCQEHTQHHADAPDQLDDRVQANHRARHAVIRKEGLLHDLRLRKPEAINKVFIGFQQYLYQQAAIA